jgi:hypothetical protein
MTDLIASPSWQALVAHYPLSRRYIYARCSQAMPAERSALTLRPGAVGAVQTQKQKDAK